MGAPQHQRREDNEHLGRDPIRRPALGGLVSFEAPGRGAAHDADRRQPRLLSKDDLDALLLRRLGWIGALSTSRAGAVIEQQHPVVAVGAVDHAHAPKPAASPARGKRRWVAQPSTFAQPRRWHGPKGEGRRVRGTSASNAGRCRPCHGGCRSGRRVKMLSCCLPSPGMRDAAFERSAREDSARSS